MNGVSVVLVTAPDEEQAARIGRTLVDEGLIACANLVPRLRSIYRWKGEVRDEAEVLLVLKIATARFDEVRARVVQLHPYELPEVLRFDADAGHAPYLEWVRSAGQFAG